MNGMQAYLDGTINATETPKAVRRGTARRIVALARPYRRLLVALVLVTMVSAGLMVITPLLAGRVVDTIVGDGDAELVGRLAAAIAVLAIVSAVLGLAERWLSARIGDGLIHDLRRAVLEHVPRGNHDSLLAAAGRYARLHATQFAGHPAAARNSAAIAEVAGAR